MAREFFKNLPDTTTPLTAPRMNALLDGDEAMGNIVVDSIRSKNIFDGIMELGIINGNTGQNTTNNSFIRCKNYISVKSSTNYTIFTPDGYTGKIYVYQYKSDLTFITGISSLYSQSSPILTNSQTKYIRFRTDDEYTNTSSKWQVEEGTTSTDYAPYQALQNQNLLWINPSPTSSFSEQTITLNDNINKYDYFEIIYIGYANPDMVNDNFFSTGKITGSKTKMLYPDYVIRTRDLTSISGTSATFGAGGSYQTYGSSTRSTDNSICVPYKILGYK